MMNMTKDPDFYTLLAFNTIQIIPLSVCKYRNWERREQKE